MLGEGKLTHFFLAIPAAVLYALVPADAEVLARLFELR